MLPAAAASRMTCLAVVTLLFGTVAAKVAAQTRRPASSNDGLVRNQLPR